MCPPRMLVRHNYHSRRACGLGTGVSKFGEGFLADLKNVPKRLQILLLFVCVFTVVDDAEEGGVSTEPSGGFCAFP